MNPFEAMAERLAGGARWHQGSLNQGDNVCIMGALNEVTWGAQYRLQGDFVPQANDVRMEAYELMKEVILEQFPERGKVDLWGKMYPGEPAYFNDDPETVFADVEVVLQKCSRIWDERV